MIFVAKKNAWSLVVDWVGENSPNLYIDIIIRYLSEFQFEYSMKTKNILNTRRTCKYGIGVYVISELEIQSNFYGHFRINSLQKGKDSIIPPDKD